MSAIGETAAVISLGASCQTGMTRTSLKHRFQKRFVLTPFHDGYAAVGRAVAVRMPGGSYRG
jgi:hypothetical protein